MTMNDKLTILNGDCREVLKTLPDASVQCCVTSPPYWGLRDYGNDRQIGLEQTPEEYVAQMVEVFREVRRVLRDDGVLFLNLGDSYSSAGGARPNGSSDGQLGRGDPPSEGSRKPVRKPKDLIGVPWLVAFALQADGWWLRQDIVWAKPNPMPESVTDRCTKAHEYVFLLTKSERYFYDAEAVKESATTRPCGNTRPTKAARTGDEMHRTTANLHSIEAKQDRNRRSVWTISTKPYAGAHFAVMPPDLVEPCIKAGTSEEGCCPACGTPWERVVEKPFKGDGNPHRYEERLSVGNKMRMGGAQLAEWNATNPARQLGWRPACTCGGSPVPCTVLDPFGGSGTTAAVALKHDRRAVIIELNPEYVELVRGRVRSITDALDQPRMF